MSMRIVGIGVIGGVALVLGRPVLAAEPEPDVRRASVEIDTSDVGEEGPVVKRRVRERTDVVLRAAGVLPARPEGGDPLVHVDIDPLQGEDPGYRFELWITRDGVLVGERRRVECTLCTESEIVQRVETTVGEILEELDAPPEPADDAPEPATAEPATAEPAPVAATPPDRPRAPLAALGKGGVALLTLGIAGLGVGATLVALPPRVKLDDPLYETTTRPPGFVVLGVGAAAAISGVAMLVVDRRRAAARSVALVPAAGVHGASLRLVGRF